MFFRQSAKNEGGQASKPKSGGLPFSQYIGEDAARELMADVETDLAAMSSDMSSFKEMADEVIKETLEEVPMIQAFRDLDFSIEEEQPPAAPEPTLDDELTVPPPPPNAPQSPVPQPVPQPAPQPRPTPQPAPRPRPNPMPLPEDAGDTWPIPIPRVPPMPPPIPPRIPTKPAPMPPQGGPLPRPVPPKEEPRPMPPMPPMPEPDPVPPPPPPQPPKEEEQGKGPCKNKEELEKLLKALEALAKNLDTMGKDILTKVDTLESAVTSRSDEIRMDLKNMHLDAIEFSKKIKDAMHEAELKDLEIQERTMKMLDAAEDRAIERQLKAQGLFGSRT